MKKILLIVFALLICHLGAKSQAITIKAANMPTAGQNIIYTTSNDSIDVSATGANYSWDFSGITPVSQDTYKFITPTKASILYTISFNGDVAEELKLGISGLYSFFKTDTKANTYSQAGMGFSIPQIPVPTPIPYTKPDVVYHFPLTYGSSDDSCNFSGSASVAGYNINILGKRVNTVDGWGKVKTPYATYDCIRVKSVVEEMDTFLIIPLNRNRIEYKWLATTEMIPVFEAVINTGTTTGGGGMTLTYRDSYKKIVNPNGPMVDFSVKDTNVFTGDSILFTNNTTGGVRYNWVITPSTFSFAAKTTATSQNPQIIFIKPGLYTVSLNAMGVGGNNTLTKTNYINATNNSGVAPIFAQPKLEMYPNPVSNILNIKLPNDMHGFRASLKNELGQEVVNTENQTTNGIAHMDLAGVHPGMYILYWSSSEGQGTEKIMVQ